MKLQGSLNLIVNSLNVKIFRCIGYTIKIVGVKKMKIIVKNNLKRHDSMNNVQLLSSSDYLFVAGGECTCVCNGMSIWNKFTTKDYDECSKTCIELGGTGGRCI